MSKISCSLATNLVGLFYDGDLSLSVEDMVLDHLVSCPSCRVFYGDYCKYHNLVTYHIFEDKLNNEHVTKEEIREALDIIRKEHKYKVTDNLRWVDYAQEWDIPKLCGLVSFRDFTKEYDPRRDDGTCDYTDFNKFMALKFCKQIDFLEECLSKRL